MNENNVPAGFVLVPMVLEGDRLSAAWRAAGGVLNHKELQYVYSAMIAAPVAQPPATAEAAINCTHDAANAFWTYWRENGETHKHGYYESTWGAINAAIRIAGIRIKDQQ